MRDMADIPRSLNKNRWFRLGCSVALAFVLALALLLIPITAGKVIHMPVPALPQYATKSLLLRPDQLSGENIGLVLPFGIPIVRATNGLTLTKTANPSLVEQGAIITYTLRLTNDTGADLSNITVVDTVPADTECEDILAPAEWLVNGAENCKAEHQALWLLPDSPGVVLADGTGVTLTYSVQVDDPLPDQSPITNDASSYAVTATVPTTYTDSGLIDVTTRVNAPEWEISKSAIPTPTVQAGGFLTYTLTVTNSGALTSSGDFNVLDVIPSNTTFYEASGSYVQAGDLITWTISAPLGPGQATQVRLVVQVDSPLTNGLTITNAGYQVFGGNVYTGASGSPVVNTATSAPLLSLGKSVTPSAHVSPGETVTYTLVISNTGNETATDVTVTDVLGAAFTPTTVTWANVSVPGHPTYGMVGTQTLIFTASAPLNPGTYYNTAITATYASGEVNARDLAPLTINPPDLGIRKSVTPSDAPAGEVLTYTIVYSNASSAPATDVLVTDTLPASLTNVTYSTSPGIAFVGGPPPYVWRDDLVAGEGAEVGVITITGQLVEAPWPSTGAGLTNVVTIRGDQAEALTTNNTSTVTNLGVPGPPYTVSVTPALPETTVGTDLPITVNVTDQFGNPVRDGTPVTFSSLPIGSSVSPPATTTDGGVATGWLSSVVSATVSVTARAGPAAGSADVIFHPGPLNHFAINVTSPQTAGITFTALITALDHYGNLVNFSDGVTLTDTTGTLVPTSPPLLVSGQGVISAIVYSAIPADVITATWGLTPVSGTSSPFEVLHGTPAELTVTAFPTTMRVCQTATLTTTIVDDWGNPVPDQPVHLFSFPSEPVDISPASGSSNFSGIFNSTAQGIISGTAQILGMSDDLNNADDMPTVTVSSPPVATGLSLSVAPNPLVTGGATAVVTATVTDCFGPSPEQEITFTLSDPSLAWFPGQAEGYTATTNASGVATATLTSNSTPMVGTLTITGTVEGLVDITTLGVQLSPTPSLTITKTANRPGAEVHPGQTLDYTLVARNIGGAEATGVVISDTLPSGTSMVSRAASEGTIISDSPLNVFVDRLAASGAITVSVQVTVTAEVSGTVLNNRASVESNETELVVSQKVSHQVITGTGIVFLPLVLKNVNGTTPPTPANANLRITNIGFAGGTAPGPGQAYHVYVVVSNVGTDAVTGDFWVDLYLNPATTPGLNQPWQTLSQSGVQGVSECSGDLTCYGRAWFVTAHVAPGEVITLTTQMPINPQYDRWPSDGAPYASRHSPMLALVDSWGTPPYGAIYENNEMDNLSGSISGTGLIRSDKIRNEATLDLPSVPPQPTGRMRPTLPRPQK